MAARAVDLKGIISRTAGPNSKQFHTRAAVDDTPSQIPAFTFDLDIVVKVTQNVAPVPSASRDI